jgi:hypothetical protein
MDIISIEDQTREGEDWVDEIRSEIIRIRRENSRGVEWYYPFLVKELGRRIEMVRGWIEETETNMEEGAGLARAHKPAGRVRQQNDGPRKERQEMIKRVFADPVPQRDDSATVVLFNGQRFRNEGVAEMRGTLRLMWRRFHDWVKSFSGIRRENQNFTAWDDHEGITLCRCQHPCSPIFNDLSGKTFRLKRPGARKRSVVHWRVRDRHPHSISGSGGKFRLVRKCDIKKFGLHFQENQEAPKPRLLPSVVGSC